MNENKAEKKPTFLQIVLTTIAAAFGVQSDKNLERDFKQSSIVPYIIAGIVFTVAFVLTIVLVVNVVIGRTSA